jgi:hypothetical protein
LNKRVDLYTLHHGIKGNEMVQVGGCRYFALELTKKAEFTTADFTVVIIADSRGVIIGHFGEEKPNASQWMMQA